MKNKIVLCFVALLFTITVFNACSNDSDTDVNCTNVTATYNSNMKSIIDSKCATCHAAGSSAEAHGVYTSYSTLEDDLSHAYEHAILEGEMPPVGSPQLTQAEKDLWVCWKEAGYPES